MGCGFSKLKADTVGAAKPTKFTANSPPIETLPNETLPNEPPPKYVPDGLDLILTSAKRLQMAKNYDIKFTIFDDFSRTDRAAANRTLHFIHLVCTAMRLDPTVQFMNSNRHESNPERTIYKALQLAKNVEEAQNTWNEGAKQLQEGPVKRELENAIAKAQETQRKGVPSETAVRSYQMVAQLGVISSQTGWLLREFIKDADQLCSNARKEIGDIRPILVHTCFESVFLAGEAALSTSNATPVVHIIFVPERVSDAAYDKIKAAYDKFTRCRQSKSSRQDNFNIMIISFGETGRSTQWEKLDGKYTKGRDCADYLGIKSKDFLLRGPGTHFADKVLLGAANQILDQAKDLQLYSSCAVDLPTEEEVVNARDADDDLG